MRKSRMPLVVTSAYMLAGTGWIVMGYFFSTALGDQATSLFELYKGLAFIAVTATALFTALYYMDAPVAATGAPAALAAEFEKSLRKSERVRRWLPVTVGLALAILLGMLLLGLTWMRENNLREGEASADALRHAIAEHTGSSLRIIDLTLSAIAQDMTAGMPPDPDVDLRRRLQVLDPLVRALWIIDGQGLITHATDTNLSGMDLSGRSYFLHHRQQKNSGIFIDTPLHSLVRGTWFISVSRAARNASGQFLGVVVAALDPEQFGRHWQMPMPGNATSVALFNRDGVLLMRSPHQADAIGKSFHDTHAWRELVPRQATGTYRAASNIDGKQRIYAFGRVPDYPLEIFIGIPKDQVLSGWYGFAAISLGSYLMAGGALILLVFTLMRQIHKRLLLQRRAAELARYPLQNRNPVLSVGPDGRILFRNAAAENLILGTRNTPAGKQLDDFLCSAAIEKNHMLRELPIGERLFSVSCVPHLPGTCDIYLTDITKPRENEALLRLFADLPLIGLAITTPDMRTWVHFNDRLCEMLGYSRSQLAARNWETLTHPEDFAEDLAWHDRLLRGKSEGYTLDKRLVCGNGAIIHALLNVQVLRHPDRSLQYLVYAVQDITERMQQEQLLLRQKNIYATLSETNEAIVRLRQRDTLFDSICRIAVDRAGFAFVWLELLDAASGTLRTVARCGEDQGYIDAIHVSAGGQQVTNHGPTGTALREGRCQITNNIAGSPAMQPWHEAARRAGVQSSGVFPVTQANKVIGTLNLYAREPEYFNPEIVALLEQMAADLSYALDFIANEEQRQEALNALKIAEQRWQFALEGGEHGAWEWDMRTNKVFYSHQWKVMLGYDDADISDTLDEWQLRVHPDDLEPLLQQVARHLRGETPIYVSEHRLRCKDGGYKWIQDRGRVIRRAADGAPLTMVGTHTDITARRETEQQLRESENKFKGLVEQSLVGIYILEGETLLYANPRAAEIFGHAAEKIIGQSIRQLVDESDWPSVSSGLRKRLSGELANARCEFRGRRKDGASIMLGAHGNRALLGGGPVILGVLQDITEKHQNEEKIQGYVQQLERSILSTVDAISFMVDLRDPYTAGHERRVGNLAAAIGSELGLDAHDIMGLRIAGYVHDVGKIAVPAEILAKPGRLSPAEFDIVKTHAEKGYEILKNIEFPWPVATAVWQHHERLNGQGYPQKLSGEQIIPEARILAVADVVESMATHRPYRPALGLEAALTEIETHAGTLFDAAVVAACLRLFREKHHQLSD